MWSCWPAISRVHPFPKPSFPSSFQVKALPRSLAFSLGQGQECSRGVSARESLLLRLNRLNIAVLYEWWGRKQVTIPSPLSGGVQRGKEIPEVTDGCRSTKTNTWTEKRRWEYNRQTDRKKFKWRKNVLTTTKNKEKDITEVEMQCHLGGDLKCWNGNGGRGMQFQVPNHETTSPVILDANVWLTRCKAITGKRWLMQRRH